MSQDDIAEAPTTVERTVVTNADNYKEVSLHYRRYRSSKLRTQPLRQDRLHCPMVDASRSTATYGVKTLRNTTKKDIVEWAQGLGSNQKLAFLVIAYLSGPLKDLPRNIWQGRFDEDQLNTGFITQIKDRINTGIIADGVFDQAMFEGLVSEVHPQYKGVTLNEDNLYTSEFDEVYLMASELKPILTHNLSNKKKGGFREFIGKQISKFEMGSLLLGILAQPINLSGSRAEPVNAMLVRDLFDLYKYGWFPAPIEDSFIKAGLLNTPS